jgi:1,4-alpha-glucan branching enzyme
MLPLSHDEVVHGKSPMLYKMPGDEWQKFANLRTLYTYMWTHPGGRLLFMGNEFGQTNEWNYRTELDWHLLQFKPHEGLQLCVKDLNSILKENPALYAQQFDTRGFEWIDLHHRDESVVVYRRKGTKKTDDLLIILNLTPVVRMDWEIELTNKFYTKEIFNSDAVKYWGTGNVFNSVVRRTTVNKAEKKYRIIVNLPPLAGIVLK